MHKNIYECSRVLLRINLSMDEFLISVVNKEIYFNFILVLVNEGNN